MFSAIEGFRVPTPPITGSFFATYGNLNDSLEFNSVVTNSSGSNVYFGGQVSTNTAGYINNFRQNSNGFITIQQSISNTSNANYPVYFGAITIDSNENLYVCGSYATFYGPVVNNSYGLVAKYSNTGQFLWNHETYHQLTAGNTSGLLRSICVTNNQNIYASGDILFNSGNREYSHTYIVNYDSNGNLIQTFVGTSNANIQTSITTITTDSNNNYYPIGYISDIANGNIYSCIQKVTSNSANNWTTVLDNPIQFETGNVDSNGNVVLLDNGNNIIQLSNTGTVNWALTANNPNGFLTFTGVTFDGNNNIYLSGYNALSTNATPNFSASYMKLYSNGGVVYQNEVTNSQNNDVRFNSISIGNNYLGNTFLYLGGVISNTFSGPTTSLLARLPIDGSDTGIHGPYNIHSNTITLTTFSPNTVSGFSFGLLANGSISNGNSSIANITGSLRRQIVTFK